MQQQHDRFPSLVLPALLAALGAIQEPTGAAATAAVESPFPPARPQEVGIDPAALERLDALAAGFVDSEEVVGCELLVVKDRRTVLHSAHGWRDVEAQRAMEPGTLFCIRSMTKPLTGVVVQQLIAEGALAASDRLADLWPAFDVEATREITVENLLNHTSGWPLSLLFGKDIRQMEGIEDVALLGIERAPDFPPGERFQYSDQNSDTLGALAQRLAGRPFEELLRERVLEPLEMHDTVCVMREGEPLRARTSSSYGGARSAWQRFWSPEDEPQFPFLLGSQGVYSTPVDYARLLEMMLRRGRGPHGRVLSRRSVRDLLEPARRAVGVAAGFDTLETWYGRQWIVWTREGEGGERETVAFGHSGSDGTWAWAFPEQDLMVLYFTQSRGNVTGLELEAELERSFLGAPFDPGELAPPIEPLLGFYREPDDERYLAVFERDGAAWFEVPGRALLEMRYVGDGSWRFNLDPTTTLRFEQQGDAPATALVIRGGGEEIHIPRLEPDEDLPGAADVLARVRAAHGLDRLTAAARLEGPIDFEQLGRHGRTTMLLAPGARVRVDVEMPESTERTIIDGPRAWTRSGDKRPEALEGRRLEQTLLTAWPGRFGDWTANGATARVLFRTELGGEPALVLRLEAQHDTAMTRYVDEATGRLVREDAVVVTPGLGEMGVSTRFSEWSEVGGALLPLRAELVFPGPLLGSAVMVIESVETPVEVPAGSFGPGAEEGG
jgi:CubicO group peptidase (beta-lactamase class C family)